MNKNSISAQAATVVRLAEEINFETKNLQNLMDRVSTLPAQFRAAYCQ